MFFVVNLVSYWLFSAVFFALDMYAASGPSRWAERKIIWLPRSKVLELYRKALPVVLLNQALLVVYLLIFEYFHNPVAAQTESYFQQLSSAEYALVLASKLFLLKCTLSILFTLSHKMFHRHMYRIHKKHHEFTVPIGLAAEYNSFLEQAINGGYIHLAIFAYQLTSFEVCCVLIVVNLENVLNHCGYNFRPKTRHHNWHHQNSMVNFSDLPWVDHLLGTTGVATVASAAAANS